MPSKDSWGPGGVPKSTYKKVPWKIGMLIYLPATSRPLLFLRKGKKQFCLPVTLRPPVYDHPFDSLHSECLSPFSFATHEMEDPFKSPQ